MSNPPEATVPETAITLEPSIPPLPGLVKMDRPQPKLSSGSVGGLASMSDSNNDLGILPTFTPSPTRIVPTHVPKAATPLSMAQSVRAKIVPATLPPPYPSGRKHAPPLPFPVQPSYP